MQVGTRAGGYKQYGVADCQFTESYMKRAKNKDVAAKMCSEIILRVKEVVKEYLWEGEDVCMFYVAPMYQIFCTQGIASVEYHYQEKNEGYNVVSSSLEDRVYQKHCSRGVRCAKAYNSKRKLWQGCKEHTLC